MLRDFRRKEKTANVGAVNLNTDKAASSKADPAETAETSCPGR